MCSERLQSNRCHDRKSRDQARYAPRQWETSLYCNDVSHGLGAYLVWSLKIVVNYNGLFWVVHLMICCTHCEKWLIICTCTSFSLYQHITLVSMYVRCWYYTDTLFMWLALCEVFPSQRASDVDVRFLPFWVPWIISGTNNWLAGDLQRHDFHVTPL